MPTYGQMRVLQRMKEEFQDLGYIGNLLQEDYAYADVLVEEPEYVVRRIPLAAFAQFPPSYRTASFGVTFTNGHSGLELIQGYRALGAPQILEIGEDEVLRWKVTGKGMPVLLEATTQSELSALFAQHKDDWAPQRVLSAKSADSVATQLDFLDLDLLPLLDYEVRSKLDGLLRDTVTLAIDTFRHESKFAEEYYPPLFRLIFRLIASKVLADRDHPGNWTAEDPKDAIDAVEDFYFRDYTPEPVLEDYKTQLAIWQRVKSTFHFQNLSVDSLAYVYENTLVTRETRRSYGIHSTPPAIAEYIVRRLPFDRLDITARRIFEPFAGHSIFLLAAMQRMRELLPASMTPDERHQYFVDMLSGIEIDPFAREVARLSLMLADYPNPDGWNIHGADAFASPIFDEELDKANVVLCNPPFEKFSAAERAVYNDLSSVWKPAEILNRVLQKPPDLLGFVLPRVFLTGGNYRELRSLLGRTYSAIEVLALPERVFQHSEAESVLLLTSGRNEGTIHLLTGEVYQRDLEDFYTARKLSYESDRVVTDAGETLADNMWQAPLGMVWEATARMGRMSDFASIHRGIEYNIPFAENEAKLVINEERPGFVPGVHRVRGAVEPFVVSAPIFLNADVDLMRTLAHKFPWNESKLIVNASRQSRGPWNISASVDYEGLVCYRNFYGIWPSNGLSLEVLAAVLNGPVANAFVSTLGGNRYIRARTLKDIPVPIFSQRQQRTITSLVRQYIETRESSLSEADGPSEEQNRCLTLMLSIDAEVLRAYDLEPRVERVLLDYFSGHSRLGPFNFTEYFPPDFKPYLPWHSYFSEDFKEAGARATLRRLPVIPDSPLIREVLSHLE